MPEPIYLDNHATTPLDPAVLEAMLPFLAGFAGNPASPHVRGSEAKSAVEHARQQVAGLFGARPNDVLFTSGATEANNLALFALLSGVSDRPRVVSSGIEHPSILEPLRALERTGVEVVLLPVDGEGRVDPIELEQAIDERTAVVSIAVANGEVGTIERLDVLAEIIHERGALLHTDAAQGAGRVAVGMSSLGIDVLTASAHKLHGPQGMGALVATPAVRHRMRPLLYGGGQERGLRSGTLNVAGVVGFGVAAEVATCHIEQDQAEIAALRDKLLRGLRQRLGDVELNGPRSERLPHNLNVRITGVDAEALIASCSEVCFSTTSACSTGGPEPSHVLTAIGLATEEAEESVRFGISRMTTEHEIDDAVAFISDAVARIRELGPTHPRQPARASV